MKKSKGRPSEKSIIKEKLQGVSKEAARAAPDRLREQFRDTAQRGQKDEYGGDQIEDTAAHAAMKAFQTVSNIKLLQSHRSPLPEPEETPLPEPETELPEMPSELSVFPESAEEPVDCYVSPQNVNSPVQECLSTSSQMETIPLQQEIVPQSDFSCSSETAQPEHLFQNAPPNRTSRERHAPSQQLSVTRQERKTVLQTKPETIVPTSQEKAAEFAQRQPKTKGFSPSHDPPRTNMAQKPKVLIKTRSAGSHAQQIKTREAYIKKQSGTFSKQNATVLEISYPDKNGAFPLEQPVGRMQRRQIKLRERYAKQQLPAQSAPKGADLLSDSRSIVSDISGAGKTDLPEVSLPTYPIKTREAYLQKHLAEAVEQSAEPSAVSHSGLSAKLSKVLRPFPSGKVPVRNNVPAADQPDVAILPHSLNDISVEKLSEAESGQTVRDRERFIRERKEQALRQQEINRIVYSLTAPDTEPLSIEPSSSNSTEYPNSITSISQEDRSAIYPTEPEERQSSQGRQKFIRQQKEKASERRSAGKTIPEQTAERRAAILSDKPVNAKSEAPRESPVHRLKSDMQPPAERVITLERNTTIRLKSTPTLSGSPPQTGSKPLIKEQRKVCKSAERSAKYTIKTAEKKSAKIAVKAPRTTKRTAETTVQTAAHVRQVNLVKKRHVYARKAARRTKKAVQFAGKTLQKVAKAVAAVGKELVACIAVGGTAAAIVIVLVCIFGAALMLGGSGSVQSELPVSEEVYAYQPYISQYAAQYGIPEYVGLIMAVMMQESGGAGSDPMQAAECGYNTRFPNVPNGITDPIYSIEIGVHELADALTAAGVENPADLEHIKLALQGYNYGPAYITWAKSRGGYTPENAAEFSAMQQTSLGWSGYGDPEYVPHVLRYYSYGFSFVGNQAIVTTAMGELGYREQAGGYTKYGDWYGMPNADWCAMFVSWCADKCGLLDAGVCPRQSYVPDIATWFQEKGQWRDRTITPPVGAYVIFDWQGDGIADHVGLVESAQDGQVSTIEGNSGGQVCRRSYSIGASLIMGYGIPNYS